DHCGKMVVSKTDVKVCPDCGKEMWQDNDVLDTWFSSALWPFSTLGWPEETEEFKKFYPTSTLVTGYDIIFFWVARMVFSALEHTGKAPFDHVFIHGIVRDSQGRKMSKSLGNGVDPLLVIEKYGADALRFTLATGNSPGNDMRYYDERVQASANFANKIWNASRFVLMNLTVDDVTLPETDKLCVEDKWILNKFNRLVQEVTANIDKFELGVAISKLYDFIWDDFCDWYIELVKPRLYEETSPTNETAQKVLTYVLTNTLVLLHPFMPFITEEIWQHLPHDGETIMRANWPKYNQEFVFDTEDKQMTMIMEAIKAIRNTRNNMNVPPSRKAKLYIKTDEKDIFALGESFFKKLASASEIEFTDSEIDENTVSVVTDGAVMYLPVGDLVDVEKERERLMKEKATLEAEVKRVEGKLNNPGFTAKAPQHLVEEERQKGIKYQEMLDKVLESLSKL
ncbi:MAG: class I tRNA ligase family protein, partial [Clostridia bacterium]|nr:class I tRNA ligase family protein [Clostridia bacterium]